MDLATQATLIGRVALGAFLGYLVGFERELRGKPAGERTFGLLSLGAAAALGILAGAGVYLSAVVACVMVLILLEVNRLPLYRRFANKVRQEDGTDDDVPRYETTAGPIRDEEHRTGD